MHRYAQVPAVVSQGNKHRQISDRLRDFQNKRKFHRTELDVTNQRIETRQRDLSSQQKELEVGAPPRSLSNGAPTA